MKKLYIYILCIIFTIISTDIHAIKAYSELITVAQPDGSRLSIRIYGDEFLNYTTTASGQLIKAGADGYYYYASFNGANQVVSNKRVGSGSPSIKSGGITIPLDAISQAQQRRAEWSRNMANYPKFGSIMTKSSNSELASLVLLVQTNDVKFSIPNTQNEFSNLLNQTGYSTNGGTGSVREYYSDNTMGRLNINFITSPVITVSKPMAYYIDNTSEMVIEACNKAQEAGINFAQFDSDNDGVVDNVYMFFAGYDKAQGGINAIWSHSNIINSPISYDGKRLGIYACSSELLHASGTEKSGIGIFAHEFGHTLGLPDLYDVDYYQNGHSAALYSATALMDGGAYNNNTKTPPYLNAIEREVLGVLVPEKITEEKEYTLSNIQNNKAYTIETGNAGEYFLIEHRGSQKWDAYIRGSGVLIYHIDKSENVLPNGLKAAQAWSNNFINAFSKHECAKLILPKYVAGNIIGPHIFYPGQNNVTAKELETWSNRKLPQRLTNIVADQTGGSFYASAPTAYNLAGTITDTKNVPLRGVKVILQKKEISKSAAQKLRNGMSVVSFSQITTKSEANIEAFTDDFGRFSFNDLPKGTYIYQTYLPNYISVSGEKELALGDNIISIKLKTHIENNSSELSWSNNIMHSAIGILIPVLYAANSFDANDLVSYSGRKITALYFAAIDNKSHATIGLSIDNKEVFSKEIGFNYGAGFNDIDISNANIRVPEGKNVKVWIKYANAPTDSSPIILDNGPAVKSKGDIISIDGIDWVSLSDDAYNANIIIGIILLKDDNEIKLNKTILQRTAWFEFAELNPDSKPIRIEYSKMGTSNSKSVDCGSVQEYVLNGLAPDITYSMKLFVDNILKAAISFATEKATSEYALIYEKRASYIIGDKLLLSLLNTSDDIVSVKWFVDDKEHNGNLLTLISNTKISAEITYNDGSTEILSRKIKIGAGR